MHLFAAGFLDLVRGAESEGAEAAAANIGDVLQLAYQYFTRDEKK